MHTVFGGEGGRSDEQHARRKTAAPQLQMTMSQLPDPRPLPRLRKRSKRNDNDVNNNYEKDNNDDNNNDVDAVSNLISRRLHVEKLIPNKSERIQILHHAHAYGCKQTTLLVGGPEGHLLYGLIVTFEDELLMEKYWSFFSIAG